MNSNQIKQVIYIIATVFNAGIHNIFQVAYDYRLIARAIMFTSAIIKTI